MSQIEANEVMELWASRQREEAERHAMVTVHDVAEATQLSPQEVQRLLQEIRTSTPVQPVAQPRHREKVAFHEDQIPFWPALLRVLPTLASGLLFLGFVIKVSANAWDEQRLGERFMIVSLFLLGAMAFRVLARWLSDAAAGKALREREKTFR